MSLVSVGFFQAWITLDPTQESLFCYFHHIHINILNTVVLSSTKYWKKETATVGGLIKLFTLFVVPKFDHIYLSCISYILEYNANVGNFHINSFNLIDFQNLKRHIERWVLLSPFCPSSSHQIQLAIAHI